MKKEEQIDGISLITDPSHILLQDLDIREEAGDPIRQIPGPQVSKLLGLYLVLSG